MGEVGGSYWETHRVKLEEEEEDTRRRIKDEERGRSKKDKKEKKKEKRDKRLSKRSSREEGEEGDYQDYQDDHEEVNEVQDGGFEVDSVGKVENSEETLQKMKSAIIGILDEEIFTLAKKSRTNSFCRICCQINVLQSHQSTLFHECLLHHKADSLHLALGFFMQSQV